MMRLRRLFVLRYCPEVPFTVREMDYMSQANQDGQRGEIVLHIQYGQEKEVQVKKLLKKLGEWAENKFLKD